MAFNLRKFAERVIAQAVPGDNKTYATVARAQARQAPPARTPPPNEQRRPAPAVQQKGFSPLNNSVTRGISRGFDQVNMLDNNRTWVNPVPTANMSVGQQAGKIATGINQQVVKPTVNSAMRATNIINETPIGRLTGVPSQSRMVDVLASQQKDPRIANTIRTKGYQNVLDNAGIGINDSKTTIGRKAVSDIGGTASNFIPVGKTAGIMAQGAKAGVTQLAKTSAQSAVAGGIGSGLAVARDTNNPTEILKGVGMGAALGGALPVAGFGVGATARAGVKASKVPATKLVNKVVETPELSPQQLGQRNDLVAQRSVAELRKPDVVPMYDKQIDAIDATRKPRLRNPLKPLNEGGYAKIPGKGEADKVDGMKWYRGTDNLNKQRGDKFYSASKDVAGDYGTVGNVKPNELPKKPLTVTDKDELAQIIGYKGDPYVQQKGIAESAKFDTLAKSYAQANGYDSINYKSGSLGEPELHVFGKPTGNKAVRQTEGIPQNQTNLVQDPNAVQRPVQQTPEGIPQQQGLSRTTPESQSVVPTNNLTKQGQGSVETLQSSTALQQRGFIQTVLDDPNTSPKVKDSISSLYATRNTKEAQIKAANLVKLDRDVAERIAANPVDDNGVFVGNELIATLQKEGKYQQAVDIVQKQAEALTASGRMSQAASTYGKLTPQGVIRFAQNEIERYNKINNVRTEKRLKLTDEQAKSLTAKSEAIQKMPAGRDKDIATKQMMKEVYELVPTTWVKKVSTLQTIAQLLNPKTTVRNVLGNTIFGATDTVSQTLAAGLDKGVSKVLGTERTTALPNLKTMAKGGKKGAKEAYQETKIGINLGAQTQFDLNDVPALRSKFFGGLEKTMGMTLRVPDRTAYQATFDDTVAGLMKANKLDKPTEGILEQAHANAMYRTFQDNSNAAQLFVGIKGALNKVGVEKDGNTWGLGDLILKYPKTPGNILARGIDYSPLGVLKGLKAITDATFAGKPFDQNTFVNSVSRSAVGTTGLVGAGAVLGALGVITEKPSSDTDTRNLQKQTGLGGYQINTSALRRFIASGFDKDSTKIQKGDTLVTYDWAQPLSIPLSAGAAIGKGQSAKDGAISTLAGASEGINTLVEQPLVTGVNTFATNIKNKGIVGALGETAKGAPASFIPTASNQTRQLTDNTSRNTYDPNAWKESLNKVVNRVPGADRMLNPQVDTLGANKQNFQDGGNNIFNVLFNPSFTSKFKPSNAAELPLNIYNNTGDTQQMPRTAKDKVKIDGKNVTLSAKQLEEYQRFTGVKTREAYTALSKDPKFMALSDEDKAKVMSNQLTDINSAAKVKLFGGTGDASDKTMDILNGKVVTAAIKKKGEKTGTTRVNEKDYYKVKDAEYKDYQRKYDEDKKAGKISELQDIDRRKKLTKLQIGAKYDKEARDLWGKSKATVFQYISSQPADKANSLTQQLTAYDQELYQAGVAKYATFKNGIAPKGRGGKRSGGKRVGRGGGKRKGGGRKGGGRAKGTTKNGEEKAKLKDYKLASLVSARSNQDRKLRQIVKSAEMSNRSKGSAKGEKVATRKYTPKKGTIKRGNSVG
jgi:hypothetical protein